MPPPALGNSVARARRMLAERIATSKTARMREPGSMPPGVGIGLNIADLANMGRSYMKQYVSASLEMIREYERKSDSYGPLQRVQSSDARDVFERAEDDAVKALPLLSKKIRVTPPIPTGLKSAAEMKVENFERTSASSDALLHGRLRALQRIAKNDRVLQKVRLCHEAIDDDWAVAIAEALEFNSCLVSLALVGNKITSIGGSRLAQAVSRHPTLTSVALGGNRLGDDAAFAFAQALSQSSTVVILNLTAGVDKEVTQESEARIGPSGIRSIAMSLSRILELDVSGQNLSDAGAAYLSSALATSIPLTFLAVDANDIGDRGICDLTRALFSMETKLRSLRIASNAGTDTSAFAIEIFFGDSMHSRQGEEKISSFFLDLSTNKIGPDGCARLAHVSKKMHVAFHGNPGYTASSALSVSRYNSGMDSLAAVHRPLRHGETGQTDTGLNLMHLEVKSSADEPRYEPFLKISTHAAARRSKRELLGQTPAFRRDKLELQQREKLGRFLPREDLPPLEFLGMLRAHMLSSTRRSEFCSKILCVERDNGADDESEQGKATSTPRRSRRVCGAKARSVFFPSLEEKSEKRITRVHSALRASFPRILASHGARYGRLSI